MRLALLLAVSIFIAGRHAVVPAHGAPAALTEQPAASPAAGPTAHIVVTLPNEKAELMVDNRTIAGTGGTRDFETPPLSANRTYRYALTTRWKPNGYTTMTRRRRVAVHAGQRVLVDLTTGDASDRARIEYVPTLPDAVVEMIKLANIQPSDVVFEPGCGDAQVTIAAVLSGARRGVGVDIDPNRVAEARARVKAAGLKGKIEIRLGDALDIKDLSSASVVFLYMGEQFNLLIRPILWRDLKVGARVVSHRFIMGDWKPDKSVTYKSEIGDDYELHLWTVTEELKRKVGSKER